MFKKCVLKCKSDDQETKLSLSEKLLSPGDWACLDGAKVWGTPYKGTYIGGAATNGHIDLSSAGSYLEGVENLIAGESEGTGYKTSDDGGSFPDGAFTWECVSVN